jgi:hypothetical protein
MTGLMDTAENRRQVSRGIHSSLGNRKRRDSHISTAAMTKPDGKVEIQNQDSHFSTGPNRCMELQNAKPTERTPEGGSLCSRLQAHLA